MIQVPAEITVNQNSAECVRTVTHIGRFAYHNICKGTVVDVPWGSGDWVVALALTSAFLFVFGFIAYIVWDTTR